jgi:hypothetical protein
MLPHFCGGLDDLIIVHLQILIYCTALIPFLKPNWKNKCSKHHEP